jgi:hypothetical protein
VSLWHHGHERAGVRPEAVAQVDRSVQRPFPFVRGAPPKRGRAASCSGRAGVASSLWKRRPLSIGRSPRFAAFEAGHVREPVLAHPYEDPSLHDLHRRLDLGHIIVTDISST